MRAGRLTPCAPCPPHQILQLRLARSPLSLPAESVTWAGTHHTPRKSSFKRQVKHGAKHQGSDRRHCSECSVLTALLSCYRSGICLADPRQHVDMGRSQKQHPCDAVPVQCLLHMLLLHREDDMKEVTLPLRGKKGERSCICRQVPLHHTHSQLLQSRWHAVNSQASLICYNLLTWPHPQALLPERGQTCLLANVPRRFYA